MKKKQKKQSVKDYVTDPNLSKEVRELLKIINTSGGPALETLPLSEAQAGLSNAQASVKVDVSGVTIDLKTITIDGYTVDLHIVRPENVSDTLPAFMFIHGGGWILGDFPTHHRLVRDIVLESGMAAVFVNYSRTSEARYPQAINEIYAATKWVADNGHLINVDGSRLAIVGNSVGGNMSTVTCLIAKEKGGPQIRLQVMMWPIVDANFDTKSYRKFGEDRFLSTSLMKWMYDLYIENPEERKAIYASPLQATLEQLKGLPPALIQTAENDILRDEGEAYGRKLGEAGVPVTIVRYNGMIHDFGLLNGLATLPAVRSHIRQIGAELKKYLA